MLLMQLAPLWTAAVLLLELVLRRRTLPRSLVLLPAVASLSCFAMPNLLGHAFEQGVIGVAHPLTIALCATSIVFAIASAALLVAAIRWRRRARLAARLFPSLCGVAFFGLAVWLAANGWIGLRTWAW